MDVAAAAAAAIAERTGVDRHDVAVVLGSGWRPAADVIGAPEDELAMAELPGFRPPTVEGHGGTIRSVRVGERRVLVLLGRTHLYEGHGVEAGGARGAHARPRPAAARSCSPTPRAASGTGCAVGEPVLIADHLNLTATSPLVGARLRRPHRPLLARACAPSPGRSTRRSPRASTRACPGRTSRRPPRSGCCAGWAPTWSACRPCWRPSPRGRRASRCSGSRWSPTSPPGITGEPLDHQEVLAAGGRSAGRMGALLRELVDRS